MAAGLHLPELSAPGPEPDSVGVLEHRRRRRRRLAVAPPEPLARTVSPLPPARCRRRRLSQPPPIVIAVPPPLGPPPSAFQLSSLLARHRSMPLHFHCACRAQAHFYRSDRPPPQPHPQNTLRTKPSAARATGWPLRPAQRPARGSPHRAASPPPTPTDEAAAPRPAAASLGTRRGLPIGKSRPPVLPMPAIPPDPTLGLGGGFCALGPGGGFCALGLGGGFCA